MIALLLLACSTPTDPDDALPKVQTRADATPLADHMRDHYRDGTVAIDAWVGGELGTAKKHLEALATHPEPDGLPASGKPFLEKMRESAQSAAGGGPPARVGQALAELGAACGGCHTASGVKPKIAIAPTPPKTMDVQVHMVGHFWAVQALWAGLVTNDDASWALGAAHLDSDPLHADAFGMPDLAEDLLNQAKAVHAFGSQAANAKDVESRKNAFAGIISACGQCHLEMRGE